MAMKTIMQALKDEVHYPIPDGFVENVIVKRNLNDDTEVSQDIMLSNDYRGAVADCLSSLIHAISFSESDKSVGDLTDKQRELILKKANALYGSIGEKLIDDGQPKIFVGW